MKLLLAGLALLQVGSAAQARDKPAALPAGATYVALGSSFGSGPGLLPLKPDAPARCLRSSRNYASLLAEKLSLNLVDATCGGATTTNVLDGWSELPPQIDAVTAEARLVTITIGGNDVNYVRNLMAATCQPNARCLTREPVDETVWTRDEANMRAIVHGIRQRAPRARIVFVDYFTLLPAKGSCPAIDMPSADLTTGLATAARLLALTAKVAREEKVERVSVAALSRGHTACDAVPWTVGAAVTDRAAGGMSWHPNYAGMRAVADALAARLAPAR
jgi:lysophospholipase L1-like esterase